MSEEEIAAYVMPPLELGTKDEGLPVWQLLNSGGAPAGYIFESKTLSPIPGFSGTPMNLLISIDLEGNFLDVTVLDHNEPVFVSGLGPRVFHKFLQQYRGLSLANNIKVGSVQNKGAKAISNSVQVDGVAKATASVRIANQSILASALKVAREHLAHVAPKPVSYPDKTIFSEMDWETLLEKGLVKHIQVTNADVEALFAGTDFAELDEVALDEPEGIYLDLWVADLGLPSVMKNVLSLGNQQTLANQLSPLEEPIIVLANGRHRLVLDSFVRNTVPDRLGASQNNFFVNVRDADLEVELKEGLPDFEQAMVFRFDTRLGFDPSSPWDFIIKAAREKGMFRPLVELRDISLPVTYPSTYFLEEEEVSEAPMWMKSWEDQSLNLTIGALFLSGLLFLVYKNQMLIDHLKAKRGLILLFTLVFVGWYAQGQLSIVTVIAFSKALLAGQSLEFMLFDPFSLLIWATVIISFVLWGRGIFCGWLCPFGVLQEMAHRIGKFLKVPQLKLSETTTHHLEKAKYLVLAVLIGTGIYLPELSDKLVEIEPFKTAITMQFARSWPYIAYAALWLVLGMFYFKAYCRFLCPLGAFMVIGGKLRQFDWIFRRSQCGTPCQLCRNRCEYGAISKSTGAIQYNKCFQCLECVEIMTNEAKCVPLILARKKEAAE